MEITVHNTAVSAPQSFTFQQAQMVFRLLSDLGGTKDAKVNWNEETGVIHVMKKFCYKSVMIPLPEDTGDRLGDQYYTLENYIKLLVRFDRAAYKRMRNVESKINIMYQGIDSLKKQL